MPMLRDRLSSSTLACAPSRIILSSAFEPITKAVKAKKPLVSAPTVCVRLLACLVLLADCAACFSSPFEDLAALFSALPNEADMRSSLFSASLACVPNLPESMPSSKNRVSITVAMVFPFFQTALLRLKASVLTTSKRLKASSSPYTVCNSCSVQMREDTSAPMVWVRFR